MSAVTGRVRTARLLSGPALAGATAVAAELGSPLVATLMLAALVVLTPVAEDLAIRVIVGLVGLLALGALAAMLPLPGPASALAVILAGMLALHVLGAVRRPDLRLVPRLGGADLIVGVGSLAYAAMLAWPYLGGSADDVLLDLARGYDNVNHVTIVANLVRHGAAPWPTMDGSQAREEGYPPAIHQLIAAVTGVDDPDASTIVVRFAGAVVVLAALTPAVAGWIGVRVSASLRQGPHRVAPQVVTAGAFVAMLLLGGDYVTTFVLGHTTFYLAAVIAAGGSWLAFGALSGDRQARGDVLVATAILAACAFGLLGSYPPLIAGLAPSGCVVLAGLLANVAPRARFALVLTLVLLALGALVLGFADEVQHLLVSTGENGSHLLVSLLALSITVILWRLVALGGPVPWVGRALAPAAGFAACAVALLVGAAITGGPVIENYYATKLLEAAWLVALPVALALAECLGRQAAKGRPRLAGAWRVGVLAGLCILLLVLPVGRLSSPLPGPAELQRRLVEADRARGQVMLIADASAAGSHGSVATVVPEPNGWFMPVDRDDGETWDWTRQAALAAQWVMALRGVRTYDAEPVSWCMTKFGDATAIPCVQDWVDALPDRRLAVVIEPGVASAPQWRAFADGRPTQVRIVEMAGRD